MESLIKPGSDLCQFALIHSLFGIDQLLFDFGAVQYQDKQYDI
jgi:hypothetical protein